jgi:hypothetical protein
MPITKIAASGFSDAVNFRNIIINGDMSIAQRGTSFTGNTASNYIVDRFTQSINGAMGTWTNGQSTEVPTAQGFSKSLIMDCTTADASPATADFVRVQQHIEGQNLQYLKKGTSNAESLTASFWVKSNKTGTYIAELEDRDNTRYVSQSYTISSANTWEKKTVTFPGDTTGAFDNDNAESLRLNFWLGGGATWTSGTLSTTWHTTNANRAVGQVNLADSTDNEWYVTGVQLEAGTSASEFEFLPVDVNLQRCKRYFQNLAPTGLDNIRMGIGENKTTTISGVYIKFEPEMRATPSLSSTDANTFSLYHSATDIVASGINFDSKSSKGGNIDVTVSSGLLDGGASQFLTASTSTRLDFSSEL